MAKGKPPQRSALGLRSIGLLKGLPSPVLDELAQVCRWKNYAAGQTVISREARDNDVYMIVRGHVQVTAYSAQGRRLNFRAMYAGECFGEFAAIDGHPRSADVVAKDNSFCAIMKPVKFRRLLHEHALVGDRVLARLTGAVRDLTERFYELSTLRVPDRVHAEMLRLAQKAGISENRARLDPAPNDAEIASNISTIREEVNREVSEMTEQGLVKRSGRILEILDVQRLEKLVTGVRRSGASRRRSRKSRARTRRS